MINTLSIANFWGQMNEDRITYKCPNLPEGIHITLAYNESSPDVNLHITKNKPKLKIEIFRISKKHLDEIGGGLEMKMHLSRLEPFDIASAKEEYKDGFHLTPLTEIDNEATTALFAKTISECFKNSYEIERKRKLRITANLEEGFELFSQSSFVNDHFLNTTSDLSKINQNGDLVMATVNGEPIALVMKDNEWFKIKKDYSVKEMMYAIFDKKKTADKILFKIKRAIIKLKYAQSEEEVKNEKSIRLTPQYPKAGINTKILS